MSEFLAKISRQMVEMPESPAMPEMPVVVVKNREGGGFRSVCALEFVGAVRNGRMDEKADSRPNSHAGGRLLAELAAELRPGESVALVFQSAQAGIAWRVMGQSATEASAKGAATTGGEMLSNLQSALGGLRDCRFSPVKLAPTTTTDAAWQAVLSPKGDSFCLSRQPLGFRREAAEAANQPALRYSRRADVSRTVFSSLAHAILQAPVPMTLEVTFEPFSLDAAALTTLRNCVSQMGHRIDTTTLTARQDPEYRRTPVCGWEESTRGYRLRCTVKAVKPVPISYLRLLGKQVFGESVESQVVTGSIVKMATAEAASLDLRGCYLPGELPSELLPTGKALLDVGANRHYNHILPDLPRDGLLLGRIHELGNVVDVRLDPGERGKHCYIVGATGTGKSTLILNLVMQDIQAGRGIGLIDPHGDLFEQIANQIPAHRAQDVVLVDFRDMERVIGMNCLDVTTAFDPERQLAQQISDLMKSLENLYDMRACGGPIFELYFRNTLLLIAQNKISGGSIADMQRVLEDSDYRRQLIENCRNPQVIQFFEHAQQTSGEISFRNVVPYIVSKLNQFLGNPIMRAVVAQPKTTINFREIMDSRKILLVNLSKGGLGQADSQLLGSMIINQLFIATLNRAGLAEADRVPFHLYVDEFQNFVSDTAAQMLAEARKYGLCLALANQNLSQLRANRNVGFDLVETILGNVGSLISFRIGPQDAERLQAYMRPEFACDDLQSLPNFTAIGRLMTSRCPTTPFAFTTLPPTAKQDEGNVPFPCLWEARSSYTISIRKKLETPEEAQERAEAIKARQAKEMEKTRQEALELLGL